MNQDTMVLRALQDVQVSKESGALFTKADVQAYRALLRRQSAQYWEDAGARKALNLFHTAARRVPAYKDFLKKQGIRPASIETLEDFSKVPVLTKKNYVQAYSLAERSWDGSLQGHSLLAMSSGTSGQPTLWPRGAYQEAESAFIHEFLLTDLYEIDKYRTLMIIGFPMGIYVSGVATAVPSLLAAYKHRSLSVVAAGNNKDSFLSLLRSLRGEYEQIILAGHPFFIKDIIETGKEEGGRWLKTRIKTLFISEGFNEVWRDYVARLAHVDSGQSLFSAYGSSEFLLMAFENPLTIAIRKHAEKEAVCESVFGMPAAPSLFQYNPLSRFIETEGADLVVTAAAGVPLIRFNQHDMGAVIPYAQMSKKLSLAGSDKNELSPGWRPWRLPFVTLYGRSDRTMIFYAANIYPEHIQTSLSDARYLKQLTGKFFMEKKYLPDMEQELIVHIELCSGVQPTKTFGADIQRHVVEELRRINLEYRDASNMLGMRKMRPNIVLHKNGDPTYFKAGLKPRFMA